MKFDLAYLCKWYDEPWFLELKPLIATIKEHKPYRISRMSPHFR